MESRILVKDKIFCFDGILLARFRRTMPTTSKHKGTDPENCARNGESELSIQEVKESKPSYGIEKQGKNTVPGFVPEHHKGEGWE